MFIPSIEDQSGSLGRAMPRPSEPFDPHQTDAILRAPSSGAVALSAGLLTAAIVGCAGTALDDNPWPAILCLPLFLGAIVGLFSADHPVRGSLVTILAAMLLFIVIYSVPYGIKDALYGATFSLPLVVPETIIGALCTATVWRYLRGRRAYAALGTRA